LAAILQSWRVALQPPRSLDPEQMDGATLNNFKASPVGIRQFAHADKSAALEWAAGARRGE
jgi:hypothetical protein